MYDIRQFKPTLYLVVLIGVSGYSLAAEAPGLWVFAVSLLITNVWLIRQGSFKPIPRLVANAVTVLAFLFAFLQVQTRNVDSPILAIGQFLVLLQVVKIWEQRSNRDYAQLLILSLLLMVAAAISTASLLFGVVFVGYLLLSLYCCLLFHLKVESDEARTSQRLAATAAVVEGPPPAPSPREEREAYDRDRGLPASMRRLTGLIAVYALVAAIAVFLFFPRGAGAGLFGQYVWKPQRTMTGFSEQVNFQQVAKITQNNDQVGTVRITRDGKPLQFAGPLLLRGYTDDFYSGSDNDDGHGKFQWSHATDTGQPGGSDRWSQMAERENGNWRPVGVPAPSDAGGPDDAPTAMHQEIELSPPTGTPVMFALPGLTRVKIDDSGRKQVQLQFCDADETIRSRDEVTFPIRYSVDSTGALGNEQAPRARRSVIDPAIAAFARQRDVTGGLAQQRLDEAGRLSGDDRLSYVSPLDEQIATRIEAYLRRNFAYTLDLTTTEMNGRDPMAAFLTDFKKGHCEYFAGAMTLLCQSLGMQARLVVGFKVDDFNQFGRYYTIRQSHAHAWVEVRTARGWMTYDPTSGREAAGAAQAPLWQRTKSLFNFLEYTWQRSVISYSSDSRDNLINSVDARLTNSTIRGAGAMFKFRDRLGQLSDWMASHVVGPLVALLVAIVIGGSGWYTFRRYKLRRRAERIGLDDLPADTQARLVRQLAFYDGLVQLLARHKINRPPHLTPMEFSQSLAFLPASAYDTISRLTDIFYRIRFGGADLDDGRQRRLVMAVERLEEMMPVPTPVER